jgi:hypothetical protein
MSRSWSMTRPSCDSTGTGGVALDMDRAGAAQRHATAEFRWDREFADSPLEESGFELMVPPRTERKWEGAGTGAVDAPLELKSTSPPGRSLRNIGSEAAKPPLPSFQTARADPARYRDNAPRRSSAASHQGAPC